MVIKNKVTFKFKEKGKAAINATDVCQFMCTGENLDINKLAELLTNQGLVEMD